MSFDQWEYITKNISWKTYKEDMKKYGLEGWEAWHMIRDYGVFQSEVSFKRKLLFKENG